MFVPSPWRSVTWRDPIGGFGQLGAQGTRWGATTSSNWRFLDECEPNEKKITAHVAPIYSHATDDTWRCRFFWGWVAWFWTKFAKLILTGTWHTCQVLPALKKLLLQGAFGWPSVDGPGDGHPMELWLLELTLWRSEGPVASLPYSTYSSRFDDLAIPYQFEKATWIIQSRSVFPARTPVSVTSKLEVFLIAPPKKHQPQPPFNMSFRGKTLATSTNSTIPPYPCNRSIPAKKPSRWKVTCNHCWRMGHGMLWLVPRSTGTNRSWLGITPKSHLIFVDQISVDFQKQNFTMGRLWKHQG